MSITAEERYITLEQVRVAMRAPMTQGAKSWERGEFDDQLAVALNAAEQVVDDYCGRTFTVSTADETREFWADHETILEVGDWVTLTSVDGRAYPGDPPFVRPLVPGKPGWPNRGLERLHDLSSTRRYSGSGGYDYGRGFSRSAGGWPQHRPIPVTGRFEWPKTPAVVPQVSIMLAIRFFHRLSSPLGVENFAGGALYIKNKDSDVTMMLADYAGPSSF